MNAVPDLDVLSSHDPDDWVSEEPQGGASDFLLFAVGASLLLLFSFLNLYSLPLGTTSVGAAIDEAPSIYGSDVEVFGVISHANEMEFILADANSTARLDAVWLGGSSLPLNGSSIVATGQMIEGNAGPAMMCRSISVRSNAVTSYDNPFTLPSLRVMSTVLVWFVFAIFSTGIISLMNMRKHSEKIRRTVRAMEDVCTVASGILTAIMLTLLLMEPALSNSAGAFTYCAATAFILLLVSSLSQNSKRADMKELSRALPMIAAIFILLGLAFSALDFQGGQQVTLLSEAASHFSDSAFAVILGISGLICLGAYIARRKSELSSIEGSVAAKLSEVR